MTTRLAEEIFEVPIGRYEYDLVTREINPRAIEFDRRPLGVDFWHNQMLKAQKAGKRISYSNEWSDIYDYLGTRDREFQRHFLDTPSWTGTVLDFTDNTLKEGITLNEDGTIADAKIVLGEKDGIILPRSRCHLRNLDKECLPCFAYLLGIKDPKKELSPDTYMWITPSGIRPVARGMPYPRTDSHVLIDADYSPKEKWFSAWMVS